MLDENTLNMRLKIEFKNPIYDILDEAIKYTMQKHHYKKYDLVKLVMMIYNKDYSFISSANDYRDQFKLLDDYFEKEFGHSIMTFIMIKAVLNFKGTEKYDDLTAEIANMETILRMKKNVPAEDLCIFSYPIETAIYTLSSSEGFQLETSTGTGRIEVGGATTKYVAIKVTDGYDLWDLPDVILQAFKLNVEVTV